MKAETRGTAEDEDEKKDHEEEDHSGDFDVDYNVHRPTDTPVQVFKPGQSVEVL